jgi:cobalt-zinc-cadmium efflux system outer membrane protein
VNVARATWVVGAISLAGIRASAQEPAKWTLEYVVQRALENHPALVASRQRLGSAEGERVGSGKWPNPSLLVSGENFPTGPVGSREAFDLGNDVEWYVLYTQTFETAGKRSHRKEAASIGVDLAGLGHEALTREVAYRAKLAFERARTAAARLALSRDSHDRLAGLNEINRIRAVEGYIAEGDFIKTRVETERFAHAVRRAELQDRQARIELLQAMGSADFTAVFELEGTAVTTVELDEAVLRRSALERPEVRLARTALARAEALYELERSRAYPDPDATFGYKRFGADNALFAGVNVPLPIFDRNEGGIARARSERGVFEAELLLQENRALGDLEAALAAVRSTGEQVKSLEADFVERADLSLSVALASYREGAADLLVVIEAERTRNASHELLLTALYERRLALHDLERAAGKDLVIPGSGGVP